MASSKKRYTPKKSLDIHLNSNNKNEDCYVSHGSSCESSIDFELARGYVYVYPDPYPNPSPKPHVPLKSISPEIHFCKEMFFAV